MKKVLCLLFPVRANKMISYNDLSTFCNDQSKKTIMILLNQTQRMINWSKSKLFITAICFALLACNQQNDELKVIIAKTSETVSPGERFEAELFLEYQNSIHPAWFYIVSGVDTFRLVNDEAKKCALFKATAYESGKYEFLGFVKFENEKGTILKESFVIQFFTE